MFLMTGQARVAKMRLIARMALTDPRLLQDYVRAFRAGHHRAESRAGDIRPPSLTREAGLAYIAEVSGMRAEGPAVQSLRSKLVDRDPDRRKNGRADGIAAGLAGDPSLGEVAYAVTRASQPARVVETGVATGVTTAYVLAALADNRCGRLESVDLPPLALRAAGLVAHSVPLELREHWTYHPGASRRVLPALLEEAPFGVFIHDSDHSYANMRWELETAWEHLEPGGWLVADDAHLHQAFQDVADAVGEAAVYVEQQDKVGLTGLARKTPS